MAKLPLGSSEKPLWVYANVTYELDEPVTGAGYYYGVYSADQFNLSSPMTMISAKEMKAAEVAVTQRPNRVIETFEGDWEKEWFTYRPEEWGRRTHKVNDPLWAAPENAKLSLQVRANEANALVVGMGDFAAEVQLDGGDSWQSITLTPSVIAVLLLLLTSVATAADRPNIVFIFADDWGWGDLSCHGHPYVKTPNIDRLAKRGHRLSSVHSCERCLFAEPDYGDDRSFPRALQH